MLKVDNLQVSYGNIAAVHGVSFDIPDGKISVILGANGAGKTTILRALSGMIPSSGSVVWNGSDLTKLSASARVRAGISQVPQGRGTFQVLTVAENLLAGAYTRDDKGEIEKDLARWCEVFPRLAERRDQPAGSLSGGEQQMLAIARALMSRPALMLLDEPSLGLAPIITKEVFGVLQDINRREGVTMLLVEQNANLSLDIAERGFVLESGKVTFAGSSDELRRNDSVRSAYLGV